MIDKRPAMIAQCESAADVEAAVQLRRRAGLEIAVRGGGHGVAGTAVNDDGLVVDLRRMNSVQVDPAARIARVGGGATWADFDRACQPFGLATTGGTGVDDRGRGLTLGGGSGWLERKFGLACDDLISVELVTADGRLLIADETKNTELFWALHGGGGNFGVATSLTFQLQQLPIHAGAADVAGRGGSHGAPRVPGTDRVRCSEKLGGGVIFMTGPPEQFVPEHLQGQLFVGAAWCTSAARRSA